MKTWYAVSSKWEHDVISEGKHDLVIIEWKHIWAVTCDFRKCGILTCVDTDEPVQPPLKLRNTKWCSVSSFNNHIIFKRLAKALIRMRVCAGWSKALLVDYTTLLEIPYPGSYVRISEWEHDMLCLLNENKLYCVNTMDVSSWKKIFVVFLNGSTVSKRQFIWAP